MRDHQRVVYWSKGIGDYVPIVILEWKSAADGAIEDIPPDVQSDAVWWALSLIGNLLWAVTCLFPVPGTAAAVSELTYGIRLLATLSQRALLKEAAWRRAAKAASIVGATIGSGTLQRLNGRLVSPVSAKAFLKDLIAQKADALKELYTNEVSTWVENDLVPYYHHLEQLRDPKVRGSLDYQDWSHTRLESTEQMKKYAVERLFFPGGTVRYNHVHDDLRTLMVAEMNDVKHQFDEQFKKWFTGSSSYWVKGSGLLASIDPVRGFGEYAKQNPFEPRLTFSRIPDEIQSDAHAAQVPFWRMASAWRHGG